MNKNNILKKFFLKFSGNILKIKNKKNFIFLKIKNIKILKIKIKNNKKNIKNLKIGMIIKLKSKIKKIKWIFFKNLSKNL